VSFKTTILQMTEIF